MTGEIEPVRRELRASHEDRDEVVERLRIAAGDGRLTLEELDQRLGVAMEARTYAELDALLTDLPKAQQSRRRDHGELRAEHSNLNRVGRWSVPRRLELIARSANMTLDFTDAIFPGAHVDVVLTVRSGTLKMVVPAGVVVDVGDVEVRHGSVRQRAMAGDAVPTRARINVSGAVRSGRVLVRGPAVRRWMPPWRRDTA